MIIIIVQEWAKKYYDASTALQNREALLDNVAEEIEKVSRIKFNIALLLM